MIFGFLLAVAFDPTIWQGATQPRWAFLAIALPLALALTKPREATPVHALGIAFLAWAALSILWTANRWDAAGLLYWMILISMAFVWGNRLESLERIFIGLALGLGVSDLILLLPPLHSIGSIVDTYPHGLLGNRNMLSELGALTALGLIAYRRWWYLPLPLLAVLWYDPSNFGGFPPRGALLALCVGITIFVWQRSRRAATVLAGVGAAAGVASLALGFHLDSIHERWEMWRDAAQALSPQGHGLASLFTLSPYVSVATDPTFRRIDHAHNEPLEILFELGIPGLFLYAAICLYALWSCDRRILPALVGFLLISLVAFPWHVPVNAFIGAVLLGHAVRGGPSLRWVYTAGRASLRQRDGTVESVDGRSSA